MLLLSNGPYLPAPCPLPLLGMRVEKSPALIYVPNIYSLCMALTTTKNLRLARQIAGYLDIPVKRLQRYLELTQESVSFEVSEAKVF